MHRYIRQLTLFCLLLAFAVNAAFAQDEKKVVGVEEHLGERIPLDKLTFFDEQGEPIKLAELFDRPIVLTLVYFKCPGICTPLLTELTKVADNCDLMPGDDYRMVTISFDPTETAELARMKKTNMIALMKNKRVSPDDWRYLTGNPENIRMITDAVGFRYVPDRNKVDFVHAATVVFLTRDGMIARYLSGTEFNPADLKLAVIDAKEGRARSFMQKMQNFCYSYDPDGRSYVLNVNRLILGVTLLFAGSFVVFLVARKSRRRVAEPTSEGSNS